MTFLQPSHVVERGVSSGFDAAVVAVDRLMSGDFGVLETAGLLLGGENLDVLAQRALIAFERQDVVGLLVQDFLGDVAPRRPKPCGSALSRLSSGRSGAASCHRWRSHPPARRSAPRPMPRSSAGIARGPLWHK